jgi:very-short-patch-repair endonuclease
VRTKWLEAHGYRVIRFWNNDVLANTEACFLMRCACYPLPDLPRKEGGAKNG